MTVGERVLELIKTRGLTQKEVSLRTGIPQSTISDWKGKRINLGSEKILILCEVLDVDSDYLLSGTEGQKYEPLEKLQVYKGTEEYQLLTEYRTLETDFRKRVLGYMKALIELQKESKPVDAII